MLLKRIKKLIKLMGVVCLIVLALCGIGLGGAGPIASPGRERFTENGIRTELVQTKDEEGDFDKEGAEKQCV
ncbi:hypothetical protein GCM10027347_56980 [Larkinella harenae]